MRVHDYDAISIMYVNHVSLIVSPREEVAFCWQETRCQLSVCCQLKLNNRDSGEFLVPTVTAHFRCFAATRCLRGAADTWAPGRLNKNVRRDAPHLSDKRIFMQWG